MRDRGTTQTRTTQTRNDADAERRRRGTTQTRNDADAERRRRGTTQTRNDADAEPPNRGTGQLATASSSSLVTPRVMLGSTGIPGPIVVVTVTFLRYRPLAAAGFSLITSSIAAA
jgi:hypothetical protein